MILKQIFGTTVLWGHTCIQYRLVWLQPSISVAAMVTLLLGANNWGRTCVCLVPVFALSWEAPGRKANNRSLASLCLSLVVVTEGHLDHGEIEESKKKGKSDESGGTPNPQPPTR
jgi:hypothetical protein